MQPETRRCIDPGCALDRLAQYLVVGIRVDAELLIDAPFRCRYTEIAIRIAACADLRGLRDLGPRGSRCRIAGLQAARDFVGLRSVATEQVRDADGDSS